MKNNFTKIFSVTALGLILQQSYAGNIVDINVSVLPTKQRVIKLRFDKEVIEPSGFITASPARIALDFPGTGINLQQQNLTFNDMLLNQVLAAQNDQYARILLDLSREGQYNAQIKGNEVWVYVSEAVATNTAPKSNDADTQIGTQAQNTQPSNYVQAQNYVANQTSPAFTIDFHKGIQNSGVIEFASNYAGEPKITRQSDRLVITLKNHALSVQDQRNLDVTDFSTPVRTISVKRLGNDTQIAIRNQGNWNFKTSGRDGNRSIQIFPERKTNSTQKEKNHFSGKTISLDFQNIDVRTILQIIAKEAGTNIVASDSVQGKMTLTLKDVPWDQALDLVLDARGLEMKRVGNIINVAPREEMSKQREEALAARNKIEELGVLVSQTFQLKYKNVEEFRKILKLDETSSATDRNSRTMLSSRGSALIDPSTNTLIITDNEFVMRKFEKLIEELDVPARQVMIEARIVEAGEGVSRDLGVKFGLARSGKTALGASYDNAKNNANFGTSAGAENKTLLNPNINLPLAAAVNSISLVHRFSSAALALELSALETENRSKIISTPRVLTQDRKEAEIKQGYQIPYTTIDGEGASSTQFKDAVMSLKVTPRITPDNKIILDIAINKDDIDSVATGANGEPGLSTKSVRTQAMIEDGATLVVGGVYQEVHANNVKKVPFLGDIPVLGNLFKSRERSRSRNELLFFITPRIMGNEASVLRY